MRQAVDVRAADVDRERLVTELQRHAAAGRLSIDEFSERARAAYRARMMGEVAALSADLPPDTNPHADTPILRRVWIVLVSIAVVVALLGLSAVANAGPLVGGMGCRW